MRLRGFEIVSKYENDDNIKEPIRATKLSAGYDLFNNTGSEIVIDPGELSEAITTKIKSYMQPGEFLAIYPRSGHGFKYSVRLANSVGIIDADYYNNSKNEGEIFIKLHNQVIVFYEFQMANLSLRLSLLHFYWQMEILLILEMIEKVD